MHDRCKPQKPHHPTAERGVDFSRKGKGGLRRKRGKGDAHKSIVFGQSGGKPSAKFASPEEKTATFSLLV